MYQDYFGLSDLPFRVTPEPQFLFSNPAHRNAYAALRAGINSLPRGQRMAGIANGLTEAQAYRYVILPQAFRIILPPLTSEFMNVIKNSSVALTIGLLGGMSWESSAHYYRLLNERVRERLGGLGLGHVRLHRASLPASKRLAVEGRAEPPHHLRRVAQRLG